MAQPPARRHATSRNHLPSHSQLSDSTFLFSDGSRSNLESVPRICIWNYNYNPIETNQLDKTIGLRLNDIYTQDWISDVNNNSQCKNYRIFKQDLKLEKYLTTFPLKYRLHLCRLRCSNSKIPTVSGRYHDIDLCDRICTLYNQSKLGDELHYLFECPPFSRERSKFLRPYYYRNHNTLKMSNLFNTGNKKILLNLSYFSTKIISKF